MSHQRSRANLREGLLFIAPYTVLWVLFLFGPLVFGFIISLHQWNPFSTNEFLGFRNYLELFLTPRFWNSFFVTWRFILMVIPGIIIVALLSALALHFLRFRGQSIFENVIFLPYLLNVSIISII
jgi:multiple sugar transport system permease protein